MVLALLLTAAHASPIASGERLEWAVSWLGVDAGIAWSTTVAQGAAVLFEAGCQSAPWLASLYPVQDTLRSEWTPGAGSVRYVTRFREGGFQQDQDMRFGADAVVIARSQLFADGWRSWEKRHKGVVSVEDPVSAFYRLREEAGPVGERVSYGVWTGRKVEAVQVWTAAAEVYDGQPALRVEVLAVRGSEDFEPKMTVWLSDDAARAPLAAELKTRAGPVRATLTRRVAP